MDETKRVVQAILSTFETGKPEGDYGAVAVLKDHAGVSYGKHQATDRGGNLDRIVLAYLDAGGMYADDLAPYVPRLAANETAEVDPDRWPSWLVELVDVLQLAGRTDPIMQAVQDRVFDSEYWNPAAGQAAELGLVLPLSMAVVYDSAIQSGFTSSRYRLTRIRLRFPEVPPARGGDERAWSVAYIRARADALASDANPTIAATVHRMAALSSLVDADNWALRTPFTLPRPYRVTVQ